jgi:hypothetical protein
MAPLFAGSVPLSGSGAQAPLRMRTAGLAITGLSAAKQVKNEQPQVRLQWRRCICTWCKDVGRYSITCMHESFKTTFKRAVTLAQLHALASAHTLGYTAATWMMQNGVPLWTAAGFLGASVETLELVYGHQSPDHLKEATLGISYGRAPQVA